METTYQPVISDVADLYTWKTTQTLTSITVGAAGQFASDTVKTLSNSFFVFVAFRGCSSYDAAIQMRAVIGAPAGAAATAIYPCAVPNNFEVMVRRNNRFNMMDQPMPQAALCSTGYRAGQQVPIPVIYPPATTFNFTLFNTAPVIFTAVDGTTAIGNRIDFGMFGYNVPLANKDIFLNQWPAIYGKAMAQLTGITIAPLSVS